MYIRTIGSIITIIISLTSISNIRGDDQQGRDEVGRSTNQLVKLRKFKTQVYNVTITPDVKLQLVRIINPLLPNGTTKSNKPILFIHGIISSVNYFLVNSIDARPKDLSHLDTKSMSDAELRHLLASDPASKSLPLLMCNLGHDVWLLNRRPTMAAQYASALSFTENSATLGLFESFVNTIYDWIPNFFGSNQNKTRHESKKKPSNSVGGRENFFDPFTSIITEMAISKKDFKKPTITFKSVLHRDHHDKPEDRGLFNNYWNFSLDEQAVIDLPIIIDFILSKCPNSKQVSTVSHSTGGAIMLMALTEQPKIHKKIGKVALWAPAMDLGRAKDDNIIIRTISRLEPVLRSFEGPVEPSSLAGLTEVALIGFCRTGQLSGEMCNSMTDAFDGIGSDQLFNPTAFSMVCSDISGSHELAQLIQTIQKGQMHRFDYGSDTKNAQIYGNSNVELYNITKIKSKGMSIWQGNTDALVTTADTMELVRRFGVPIDYRYIDGPGIKFDHSAFMLHKNVSTLLNIPTAKFLEQD